MTRNNARAGAGRGRRPGLAASRGPSGPAPPRSGRPTAFPASAPAISSAPRSISGPQHGRLPAGRDRVAPEEPGEVGNPRVDDPCAAIDRRLQLPLAKGEQVVGGTPECRSDERVPGDRPGPTPVARLSRRSDPVLEPGTDPASDPRTTSGRRARSSRLLAGAQLELKHQSMRPELASPSTRFDSRSVRSLERIAPIARTSVRPCHRAIRRPRSASPPVGVPRCRDASCSSADPRERQHVDEVGVELDRQRRRVRDHRVVR